jgi:hypothetical protein
MTRDEIIQGFTARAERDDRVAALFLGGSLGKGVGDDWSDVDLILAVRPEHHGALVSEVRAWADSVAEVVLWKQVYPGVPLYMAVTAEWLRFDLTVTIPGHVVGAQATLKPLVDRDEVWVGLPETLAPKPIDPNAVTAVVEEALRILGLLPLAVGRGEFVSGVTGAGLVRQQLVSLMIMETEPPLPPGALHLSRLIPAQDLATLEALPGVIATRESVIAANLAYAAAFLDRARILAGRIGAIWPHPLEDACRAHWRQALGLQLP